MSLIAKQIQSFSHFPRHKCYIMSMIHQEHWIDYSGIYLNHEHESATRGTTVTVQLNVAILVGVESPDLWFRLEISILLYFPDEVLLHKPNAQWGQTSCDCISGHSTKWTNKSCFSIFMFEHNNDAVYTPNAIFLFFLLQLDKWQCHCLLTVKPIMYTKMKEIIFR